MSARLPHAERHIRALALAKQCVTLGARIRTVGFVTGLPHSQLRHLFFGHHAAAQRGRPPDSPEWFHTANLINRAEASIFVAIYRRIRNLGFAPSEALVAGYRHYQSACRIEARISFDRAFDLTSHVEGIWRAQSASLALVECPVCASRYLTTVGVAPRSNQECLFCKLVLRYPRDPRIQLWFAADILPDETVLQRSLVACWKQAQAG